MPRALHLGLRRAARRGRKVADVHLTLTKLQKLPEIAAEDRACHPEGSHLPDRRQPQNPQEERHGQGVAAEASQDRACLHPESSGVAEPHRGVVAYVQAAGAGRGGFRRQLRDRTGGEGRHPAIEPQSETMGVGPPSQIAKASETHFCVPYLRNGALSSAYSAYLRRFERADERTRTAHLVALRVRC
jgi:hypothetical protein